MRHFDNDASVGCNYEYCYAMDPNKECFFVMQFDYKSLLAMLHSYRRILCYGMHLSNLIHVHTGVQQCQSG